MSSNGYGNACDPKTGLICNAHRLSFMAYHHEDIANKMVLHSCNERMCANPDHLRLGTHRDNMDDVARSGLHGGRRLTNSHPEIIRKLLKEGVEQRVIARAFNVSQKTIWNISKGHTYRFD